MYSSGWQVCISQALKDGHTDLSGTDMGCGAAWTVHPLTQLDILLVALGTRLSQELMKTHLG